MQVNFSKVAAITSHINNPNKETGTLIEESFADIGRSWEGYKRGGIIEGAEKLRKEIMAAIVWLFGIKGFKKGFEFICEKALKIPMNIDYSNSKEGNKAIEDSINFLVNPKQKTNLDTSELKKYGEKFKGKDPKALIKKLRTAKKINSTAAVILNCIALGIILPKVNQKITKNKIEKMKKEEKSSFKPMAFDEFTNKTKDVSFKGKINMDNFVYKVENDSVFRLVVTDIPMIIGRFVTGRNFFDGFEHVIMDGLSIHGYNYCLGQVQKALRKLTNTPKINPKVAELLQTIKPDKMKDIINNGLNNSSNIEELFKDKNLVSNIYKEATYGKYGKINRFVKNSELKEINTDIFSLLNHIKTAAKKEGKEITPELIKNIIKKTNNKNGLFLALGLGVSILELAVLIPKFTFWTTKKLTGKNEFTGTADYSTPKKSK